MGESHDIDLINTRKLKKLMNPSFLKAINFLYTLPHSEIDITFKILDGHDETKIEKEIQGLKKLNKNASPELSTRLKYIITSVNGDTEKKTIRDFVENGLLARDSRLSKNILSKQPNQM